MAVSNTDLIRSFTSYIAIARAGSSQPQMIDAQTGFSNNITDLNGKLSILDGQEDTYNEIYKNAKEHPKNFGLFSKIGLRTTQDWVLAYFYFSYILFSILLLFVFLKVSKHKSAAAMFVVGITLSIGVLSTMALLSYA